jgi:hypothetical protein
MYGTRSEQVLTKKGRWVVLLQTDKIFLLAAADAVSYQ